MELTYKIAGLTVRMGSFGRIVEQARPYLVEDCGAADVVIESHWEELKAQYDYLSDSDGEYIFSGSSFYRQLLDFDGLMLHSSAVVVDGRAYLFSADSGTGKSTHTGLWLKRFGERAFVLNDDKPALRLEDGVWYAYGTPWSGKHDISVNERVPVAGVAMVERAQSNSIEPFGGREAILAVYQQVNRPRGMDCRIKLLELLDKLFRMVPVWKLRCNMEPEAAEVSYAAMSAGRKDD